MCRAVIDKEKVVRVQKMTDEEIKGFLRIERYLKNALKVETNENLQTDSPMVTSYRKEYQT
jgi:hypothetical protein